MYPAPSSETHPEKLEELLSLRCAQRMELPSDSVTTKLLRRVVECKGLFVALVRGTRLVTVVDRTTLATQLALAQLEP